MGKFGHWIRRGAAPAALWAVAFFSSGARADDRPFAFAYSTDIEAQGEKEIEQ
jgi:hypothetical protein